MPEQPEPHTLDEMIAFQDYPAIRNIFAQQIKTILINYKNQSITADEKNDLLNAIKNSEELLSYTDTHPLIVEGITNTCNFSINML